MHPSYAKLWVLKKEAFEPPSKIDVLRGRGAKKKNWPEIGSKALSKLFLGSFQKASSGFKMVQDEAQDGQNEG